MKYTAIEYNGEYEFVSGSDFYFKFKIFDSDGDVIDNYTNLDLNMSVYGKYIDLELVKEDFIALEDDYIAIYVPNIATDSLPNCMARIDLRITDTVNNHVSIAWSKKIKIHRDIF